MDDFIYMRNLLETFGPDISRPAEVDELYDEILANINPAIENTVSELIIVSDNYYEEIALQSFIAGYKLANKINTELVYHSQCGFDKFSA